LAKIFEILIGLKNVIRIHRRNKVEDKIPINEIKKKIMECLDKRGVVVKSIILFGSRARGDFSKYSDYDLLIITEKTFTIKEKREISKKVNKVLARMFIPSDIIINSEEEVEYKKDRIGCVTRYALKEGVKI
jgi:predicted nucleotidyltransferase